MQKNFNALDAVIKMVNPLFQCRQTLGRMLVVRNPFFDMIDAAADRCRPPDRAAQVCQQRDRQRQQRKSLRAHE